MNDNTSLFSRLGNWFKKGPIMAEIPLEERNGNGHGDDHDGPPVRSTFLRPWVRREEANRAILREGFTTLTDLMASIRDGLDKQADRQDQILRYLAHLPGAVESLPESNRVQSETLRAIHGQLEHQNAQQKALAEILERICETGGSQKQILDALSERVDTLSHFDQAISENLHSVGSAMQSVSQNSQTSAQVLQQIRDNMHRRDGELEGVITRQGNRFTVLLSIAIFLSIAALGAVTVMGYLMLNRTP